MVRLKKLNHHLFQNQTKKCWCIYPYTFGETCCVFSPGLVPHSLLFLLRFCPLFSADSALDWSRTLWWFWFWLVWIFSHIQLSNFTPVQLKTWWNSQIQPTSENTNRDAGQKLILEIGSEATRVLWAEHTETSEPLAGGDHSDGQTLSGPVSGVTLHNSARSDHCCKQQSVWFFSARPDSAGGEPWVCPAASSRDTGGFFFCVTVSAVWASSGLVFPPNCH